MLSAVGERVDMGTVHMHCRNKMSNKDAELTGAKHETQKTAFFLERKVGLKQNKGTSKNPWFHISLSWERLGGGTTTHHCES